MVTRENLNCAVIVKGRGVGARDQNPTVITVYKLACALGVSHLDLLQPYAEINE